MKNKNNLKVLWLAPNFNHYKARFLNYLAKEANIELTIMSGTGRANMGDQELDGVWRFEHIRLNVSKRKYGNSKVVKNELKSIFNDFNWVLIPAEKKNLPLFLFAMHLRKKNKQVNLFSYNHPILKSKNGKSSVIDRLITKFYYNNLDRVIFYTEQSYDWALKTKLIKPNKAFWANNTIDNLEVEKHYSFKLPPLDRPSLLFIGRLISSKRLDLLIKYYNFLKLEMPNIRLDIIGDGPESILVKSLIKDDQNVSWYGTLVEEAKIAPIMAKASIVFVPGHSGLSINHAFAYGRPYVTLQGPSHAPELDYIEDGKNGYVLKENIDLNVELISELFKDRIKLERFCENAKLKGEELSVQNWVKQMKASLLHD